MSGTISYENKLRAIFVIISLIALLAVLCGGFFYYSATAKSALQTAHTDAKEYLKTIQLNISSKLDSTLETVTILAGLEEFRDALRDNDPDDMDSANKTLDHFQKAMHADVCYLMDSSGNTIASSNRNSPGSFVGKNYGFRPYFRKAMEGSPFIYLALGVTSQKRGAYFSHPVFRTNSTDPLGVVVIKTSVAPVEEEFGEIENGAIVLVDPHGIIFVSSRSEWRYKVLSDISSEERSDIERSKQFGKSIGEWVGITLEEGNSAFDTENRHYKAYTAQITDIPGWLLIYLLDEDIVVDNRLRPVKNSIGIAVVMLFVVAGLAFLILYERADAELRQRKEAEEALRESEEKLTVIFDTVYSGIILVDADGVITFANRRMATMLNCEMGSLIGSRYAEHVHESQRDEGKSKMYQLIRGDVDNVFLERLYQRKDGSTFWGHLSGNRLSRVDGSFWALVGVITDISEKKELEEQVKHAHKMEAIGTLSGGIAHEFNNMLGIILGNAELAAENNPDSSPGSDFIAEIENAALRAKDVVRKLLTIAKKAPADKRPIRICPIVQEGMDLLRKTIPTTIEIRSNISCPSAVVYADPTEVHQVMMNLFTNAAHAIGEKVGVLEVTLEHLQLDPHSATRYDKLQAGDYVRLAVSDSGKGIEPENIDRVFDPYFTTKDIDQGLGMGLAVVRGIVENTGGSVQIESVAGKGTVVEVLFPLIDSKPAENEASDEALPTGRERILLVDDEPSIVKMAKMILEQLGYTVVGKTESKECLKLFKRDPQRFDLVITDMTMPDISGDRLARQMLHIRPDLPVILCTGHSDRINEDKAEELGIKAFAMKPLGKRELAETVRKVLDDAKGWNSD